MIDTQASEREGREHFGGNSSQRKSCGGGKGGIISAESATVARHARVLPGGARIPVFPTVCNYLNTHSDINDNSSLGYENEIAKL
jgi:hypothetical protein